MDIMKKYWSKKTFQTIPGAFVIPLSCSCTSLISLAMMWCAANSNQLSPFVVCGLLLFFIGGLIGVATSIQQTMCRVELFDNFVTCTMPFGKRFHILYSECNIGIDYHIQNGNKVWWIYLCRGSIPTYNTNNPANRMNTLKCQPGFIRIIYREEVYEALIAVLPKRQKNALESSCRCAEFEKQGRII